MPTDSPEAPAPDPAHSAFRVLGALADLGEATAAAIAQHAGLAYSTVTPKLRTWETSGHAEKYRHAATNQTLWRLTTAGRAATGAERVDPLPHADTDTSKTDADRVGAAPPVEPPTPSDAPPAEPDSDPPHTGTDAQRATEPPASDVAAQPADKTAGARSHDAAGPDDSGVGEPPQPVAKRKRPAGALQASALMILRDRPHETFTVNDLRKLIDTADDGTGYPAASAGATANALTKLTGKGQVDMVQEKPATFQAAPDTD